jgi:hypothetical protein
MRDMLNSIASWSFTRLVSIFVLLLGQPSNGNGMMDCRMCHEMGGMWVGMLLFALLLIAIIAALVALTIYLVRHSRPPGPHGT